MTIQCSDSTVPGGHGIARNTQVRLFLTLWLVYLVHWSPFIVRELYLTMSLVERGSVRVDPYVELHPDLFSIPGRGSYLGGNPGASFAATAPYFLALPLIDKVAPVRPAPPEEQSALGEGYDENRINRLRFFRRAKELGILMRLAVGALVTSGFFMAPLTALGAVALLRVLGRMGFDPGAATWMAVLFGLGTPLFLRAGTLSLNLMVGLCALFAFALMWRPHAAKKQIASGGTSAGQPGTGDEKTQKFRAGQLPGHAPGSAAQNDEQILRGPAIVASFEDQETAEIQVKPPGKPLKDREWLRYAVAGFLAGWGVLTDYTGAVTAAVLGLFALWLLARRKPFVAAIGSSMWFLAGAVIPVALLLYYQWICFGDPWLPAQFHMPKKIFVGYPSEHGFGWPLPAALWGLLFDPQYGLLVFSPVFALALYHPVLIWRKRNLVPGHVAVFAWVFFAALYIFCSMIHYTLRHQWQDGVRYIVPALPFLFLLVADVLVRARRWLVLLITLAAVGESWAIAMVRESPYQSLQRILADGIQYPWLTVLHRVPSEMLAQVADPASLTGRLLPWGVLLALLASIWVIWAVPAWGAKRRG